jgi:hypothetical protein
MGLGAQDIEHGAATRSSSSPRSKVKPLGWVALAFYAVHAGYHVVFRHPADALWTCHVATALIGVGALSGWPSLPAIGVCWLIFGNPLWALELLTGGDFLPTSLLTHVGGLVTGVLVVKALGWPRGVWWKALLALCGLVLVTRLVTPAASNVNMAFSVYAGWEHTFTSYPLYLALLLSVSALAFLVIDVCARRLAP